MLINSTRASSQSSPPWRLSTPRPRLAATDKARTTKGTPRPFEGLTGVACVQTCYLEILPRTLGPAPTTLCLSVSVFLSFSLWGSDTDVEVSHLCESHLQSSDHHHLHHHPLVCPHSSIHLSIHHCKTE